MLGNRVVAAGTERMTAQQTAERQPGAEDRPVPFERRQRVEGARRLEAATAAEPGAEKKTIAPHGAHQEPTRNIEVAHKQDLRQAIGADRATLASTASSSRRITSASASEAALMNRARSIGARRRTTQRPGGMPGWRPMAARIWRFSNDLVTERRACRFGITVPSHKSGPGAVNEDSSTGRGVNGTASVDKSGRPAAARAGREGLPPT